MAAEDYIDDYGDPWYEAENAAEFSEGRWAERGRNVRRQREQTFVEFDDVRIKRESERAVLAVFPDGRERWVPKSQLEPGMPVPEKDGDPGTISIAEWLAEKIESGDDEEETKPEKKWVDVADVVVLRETAKALQVRVSGGEPVWVPFSQIADDSPVRYDGESGVLRVSEWIAKEKGFDSARDEGDLGGAQRHMRDEEEGDPVGQSDDDSIPF